MSVELARAHILGQERLRGLVDQYVAAAWEGLPGYDEDDVPVWLSRVVPLVTAGQRQSVALTRAYLARSVGGQPLEIPPIAVVGAVRNGTMPQEVYRRPFVTVWTALANGTDYRAAVRAGLARATGTAATDVQMTMRATLQAVGDADERIVGYQRVPDAGACEFCQLVAGQRYLTSQLMPIHNRCGCGVDVITAANRSEFSGRVENDLSVEGAAVHEHGELGPVLTSPDHDFTTADDIAA